MTIKLWFALAGCFEHDVRRRRPQWRDRQYLPGGRPAQSGRYALERQIGNRFAVQGFFERLSHGQVIGAGRNQGFDEAGVRFVYRLKPE